MERVDKIMLSLYGSITIFVHICLLFFIMRGVLVFMFSLLLCNSRLVTDEDIDLTGVYSQSTMYFRSDSPLFSIR